MAHYLNINQLAEEAHGRKVKKTKPKRLRASVRIADTDEANKGDFMKFILIIPNARDEKGLREFWLECSNALDNMPLDDETRHAIKTAKSKAYEQWRALPL